MRETLAVLSAFRSRFAGLRRCAPAAFAFDQQACDQRGLQQQNGECTEDLPAVFAPQRPLAIADFAPVGQARLVDRKLAQHACVRGATVGNHGKRRDRFPGRQLHQSLGGQTSAVRETFRNSGNHALTKMRFEVAVDRRGRHRADGTQDITRHIRSPVAVAELAIIKDNCVRPFSFDQFNQFWQRHAERILDLRRSRQLGQCIARQVHAFFLGLGYSCDEENARRVGLELTGQLDSLA